MNKNTLRAPVALGLSIAVTGCVTPPPAKPVGEPPVCITDADCAAKWDASQLFVVKNAGLKIQLATNVLIETYNSTDYSSAIAMQVTKEPLGGGMYRFVAKAWCANMFGCTRRPNDVLADFNSQIGSIGK